VAAHDLREVLERLDRDAADLRADARRVGVDESGDADAAGREAAVGGQGRAEVADADDDDVPVLGLAQLAGDLVAQVLDVVAHAPRAIGAEVGQVLAELGRVDARRRGELVRRAHVDALVGERRQRTQVHGKSGHGGIGDAAISRSGGEPVAAKYGHGAPSRHGPGLSS
jgi:hypothetical protein